MAKKIFFIKKWVKQIAPSDMMIALFLSYRWNVRAMKKRLVKKTKTIRMINKLNQCIQADQLKLCRIYIKSIAGLDKNITRVTALLNKLNKKIAKIPHSKNKSTDKATVSSILSLGEELISLKAEKLSLGNGQNKLTAQQNLIRQFEKEWVKNTRMASTEKKKKTIRIKQKSKKSSLKKPLIKYGSAIEQREK